MGITRGYGKRVDPHAFVVASAGAPVGMVASSLASWIKADPVAHMPVWFRAFVFVVVVPGAVAGWIPWRLAGPRPASTLPAGHVLGIPLLLLGWAGLLWGVADFVRHGRGTPGPYDPPRALVDTGLYRVVRNPMYVSVVLAIAGCALWRWSPAVVWYGLGVALAFHLMVVGYEEPHLGHLFGASYASYRARVPRWLPRAVRPRRG
jgi:protein-S-isoprenylcysteine O-methyltransferase Ste14